MSDDQTAKPRREITEEHRQKLREQLARGRETRQRNAAERKAEKRMVHTRNVADAKAAPAPTEAKRADVAREDLSHMPEEQLTRRSREERDAGALDVPRHMKKPGWDYEYKSIRCLGQPTDGSDFRLWAEQGWRPVMGHDMPKLLAPGEELNQPIETMGCRLYTRPMSLTMQAKEEDYATAMQQRHDKAMQAATGRGDQGIPNQRGLKSVPVEIQMEELMGVGTGRGS
jgi:hypothetical protein